MKMKRVMIGILTAAMLLGSDSSVWANTSLQVTEGQDTQEENLTKTDDANENTIEEDTSKLSPVKKAPERESGTIQFTNGNCNVSDANDLIVAANYIRSQSSGTYTISIDSDFTLTSAVNFDKSGTTVIINGNGHTITISSSDGTISVSGGASLNIEGNLNVQGSNANNGKALIQANGSNTKLNITNATVKDGKNRGIYINAAIANLKNVVVENNFSTSSGGGIAIENGKLNIADCSINLNRSTAQRYANEGGGGIFAYKSDLSINGDCLFESNQSKGQGGAIMFKNADWLWNDATYSDFGQHHSLYITGNSSFKKNHSDYNGAGIYSEWGADCKINGASFVENDAGHSGGAFKNSYSKAVLKNVIMTNNTAGDNGGGISCDHDATMDFSDNQNKIYNNTANKQGDDIGIEAKAVISLFPAGVMQEKYKNTGYLINGWYEDPQSKRYKDNMENAQLIDSYSSVRGAKYLVAAYNTSNYVVGYDLNGGMAPQGASENEYIEKNVQKESSLALAKAPVKTGNAFLGWKFGDEVYKEGTSIKPSSDMVMVAQWRPNQVTYNPMGGTVTPESDQYNDEGMKLPVPLKAGYTFAGWEKENGEKIATDEELKAAVASGDLTLKAQWKANKYTIKFDANGGSGIMNPIQANYDEDVSLPKNAFSRENYYFKNWNTQADGKGTSFSDQSMVKNLVEEEGGTVTLYAQWKNTAINPNPITPVPSHSTKTAPATPQLNKQDHYAYIVGYPDGSVHPSGDITRAETAAMFFRLLTPSVRDSEFAKVSGTQAYSDVQAGSWYYASVAVMKDLKIVSGYPDGTFRPNSPITRAEFAAIAERFNTNKAAASSAVTYSDIAGHWAEKDIRQASTDGWIYGYPDGTFKPNNHITRAEAMAIVNRVLTRYPDTDYAFDLDKDPELKTWTDNNDRTKWYYLDVQEATNSHTYHRTGSARKAAERTYNYHTEWWDDVTKAPDWSRYKK